MSARKRKPSPAPEPESVINEIVEQPGTIECVVRMHQMTIDRKTIPTQESFEVVYHEGDIIVVPLEFFERNRDSLGLIMEPSRKTEIEALEQKIAEQAAEIKRLQAGYE